MVFVYGSPDGFRIGVVAAGIRWNIPDIVYVAVGGLLFLMTLIEMLLFSISFSYAFIKVAQKSKRWQERIMAVFMLLVLWLLRLGALSLLVSAIPVPDFIILHFPPQVLLVAQILGIALAATLLILPALVSIFQSLQQTNQEKVHAAI